METQNYTIREFVTESGKNLYRNWLDTLDSSVKARIQARILRLETGNLGNCESVGKGVFEVKLNFGPGYRVYYSFEGQKMILLLGGGNKSTQSTDIKKAQNIWNSY